MTPEVLDTSGAAEMLGVTVGWMERWRRTGKGPPYIPWGPRTVRYRVSDLKEFLDAQLTARNTAEAARMMGRVA
jgi:predicted DNA-binding transcriptional regulator AlpA